MERPAFTYGHIWTFQCQIWQQLFHQYLFLLNCWPACISFARPDSLQLGIRGGKSLSETLTLEGLPPQVLKCKMFSKPKRNPTHAICQLVIMALIPFLNLLTIFLCVEISPWKTRNCWNLGQVLDITDHTKRRKRREILCILWVTLVDSGRSAWHRYLSQNFWRWKQQR